MPTNEIERVLSNWIREGTSHPGQLDKTLDSSTWIAQQFLKWWRTDQVERPLGDAALAMHGIRKKLDRLGGWSNPQVGEAMHDLIHLEDAITELREALGLIAD